MNFNSNLTPAIQVNHLSFGILKEINFSILKGNCVACMGPNGSGKTTLFHLLVGLKNAESGSVQIFGMSPSDLKLRTSLRFLPERPYLPKNTSLYEWLRNMVQLQKYSRHEAEKITVQLLESVNLIENKTTLIEHASKGMLQRLMLAQVMSPDVQHDSNSNTLPKLVVLDEPFSGLDPEARTLLMKWIQEEKAKGTTLLLSTHRIEELGGVQDQVITLRNGILVEKP